MIHDTITELMDALAVSDDDDEIRSAIVRLDAMRRLTSGDDRACVCWAMIECL
jgi:ribosome assembly protein YihI (activator of Der GTPase)